MPEFDSVIKDGMIVDGTRAPRLRGDVGIKNGRVAKVGRVAAHEASKVIDASGLVVAPGFIDLHTHYDAQIFWDPYLTISAWHGIPSVVIGNCGFGFAPVKPDDRERAMLTMVRTEAIPLRSMKAAMPFDWETYPQFMDKLDKQPKGINLLPYVPMNPLMGYVMGVDDSKTGRMPTDQEHATMRRLLNEAMDAGACGWSAQRLKPDGPSAVQRDFDGSPMKPDIMHDETCIEMAKELGDPRRREALKTTMPRESLITSYFDEIIITEVAKPENKHLEGLTLRKAAAQTAKHPVDVMLDLASSEDLKTEFFAPAINQNSELMKELIEYPYLTFGVSDDGAHTKFLTAGRFPTEGIGNFCP